MCVMSACVSMKQSIGLSGLSVWVMCIRRQIADSAGPGGLAPLCNALSAQWRVTSPSSVSHTSYRTI